MEILRRQEDGSYDKVAEVFPSGEVNGGSVVAEGLREEIKNEGIFVQNKQEYVSEGIEMLLRLENRYSNGYFISSFQERDYEEFQEYATGELRIFSKQEDAHTAPEETNAPSDCITEYVDDPSEAPEGARVYDGVEEDAQFYCTNYFDVNAFAEDFIDEAIQQREELNEELRSEHQLQENEFLTDKEFDRAREGDELVIESQDLGVIRGKIQGFTSLTDGPKVAFVTDIEDDSKGEFIAVDEWNSTSHGVVVQGEEGEKNGQWEGYTPPRDIYTPNNVKEKQPLREFMGVARGVNSMHTFTAKLDNGERVIYKPHHANAYKGVTRTDVAWYEFIDNFSDDPEYAPETAAADLKNGLGSAQIWKENTFNVKTHLKEHLDENEASDFVKNNMQDLAEMTVADYIWGNDDRSMTNMLTSFGQIFAIDNGGYAGPSIGLNPDHLVEGLQPFKYIERNEGKDALEDSLIEVISMQMDMIEDVIESKEEVINIARMTYGVDSRYTHRIRDMLEGEDPRIEEHYKANVMSKIRGRFELDRERMNRIKEEAL